MLARQLTSRLGLNTPSADGSDPAGVPADLRALALQLDVLAPIGSGLLSNRPVSSVGTPGIRDRLYFATDSIQLYRDTGTGWIAVGPYQSLVAQGNFIAPAVTGLQSILGLGFQPKKLSFHYVDVTYDLTTHAFIATGGAMPGTQYAICSHASPTLQHTQSSWSRCIFSVDAGGTIRFQASYDAVLPDGFRINWLQVDATHELDVTWEAWG